MADKEELKASIVKQGDVVRDLKSKGATKDEVTAAVTELLALKTKYEEVAGEPYVAPGAKKGKGKGKKAKGPASDSAAAPSDGGKQKKDKKQKQQKQDKKQDKQQDKQKTEAPKAEAAKDKAQETEEAQSERFDIPGTESEMIKFWESIDAFQTSTKFSEGRPEFTFYDGPPFATGLPHYGHLLAGTIKDVVTRFAHQTGHHVPRRFGWDCHGLPVEYEIDKTLNIKGPDDVMKMGIDKYNAECRGIVTRYSSEWRRTVTRLGRWIDFDNDYKTMYPWFMESVWWVFKEIFNKGLVYRGFKVMPFSTALATPLSNFEANQDMHEVNDPSVTVTFPLVDEPEVSFLAWTTTPWTLPSNLALCVHPDFEYCKFKDVKKDQIFIALKSRVVGKDCLYTKAKDVEFLETFKGSDLADKKYTPLFPYFADREQSFRVLVDTYVTDDSGTGVVHNAPGHGEDDYRVCLAAGVITAEEVPCPVDASGKYTEEITDYVGTYIKDADAPIIARLKKEGRVFKHANVKHAYPHCWRSGTPLIRKTVDSWFIRVEDVKEQLLVNNDKTYWVPNNIREGRFRNWLAGARDWAISRNRFWGTPIPLWVSEDFEEVVCIGSIEELEELSGVKGITDLHRESIDHITIPSKQGKGDLKRISQVFDCWFESGSMPYAQRHYPFEDKDNFERNFPADFIAEGIDQTRGWFYTLLVIGTCLFQQPPWKNLIVNGLVLASDGKKMSKRLKNYPDPNLVLQEDGADALRLYLITSPAVRAENLRFERSGVQALNKDVMLPWLNSFRFFEQQVLRLEDATGTKFSFVDTAQCPSTNQLDRWVLAYTQHLISWVRQEMAAYRLYTVVPKLLEFIDNLTNIYVRFNRHRLKGGISDEDAALALWTLGEVLMTLTKTMAPFTPFFAEWMYQQLKPYIADPETATGCLAWGSEDVASWMQDNNLGQFAALFQHNGIRGRDFVDLCHNDLVSMGISHCSDRKRILRAVQKEAEAIPFKSIQEFVEPVREIDGVKEDASVHFCMVPQPKEFYADPLLVQQVEVLRRTIEAARVIRERNNLPTKYPLVEAVVVSKTPAVLEALNNVGSFFTEELNIRKLVLTSDESQYNVKFVAKPNFAKLGRRLQKDFKAVQDQIKNLTQEELYGYQTSKSIVLSGHTLSDDDILLTYEFQGGETDYSSETDNDILVLVHVNPPAELVQEGYAREVKNRVQRLRKAAGLSPLDKICVYYTVENDSEEVQLAAVIAQFKEFLETSLTCPLKEGAADASATTITADTADVKGVKLNMTIVNA
eukprot:m.116932 g.116932  ORF g.116932 m.116932 type:complete len:1283 (-) comp13619_c0_seq1:6698-10546(-)